MRHNAAARAEDDELRAQRQSALQPLALTHAQRAASHSPGAMNGLFSRIEVPCWRVKASLTRRSARTAHAVTAVRLGCGRARPGVETATRPRRMTRMARGSTAWMVQLLALSRRRTGGSVLAKQPVVGRAGRAGDERSPCRWPNAASSWVRLGTTAGCEPLLLYRRRGAVSPMLLRKLLDNALRHRARKRIR